MSVVPDHPDIEKLPPEIDGIPVRETIRQLFREPVNGTPDNISKEGCLALALKSNELGGAGKGYVVWNTWRETFPVKEKNHAVFSGDARDSYLQRFRYQNVTDFTNVKTENGLFFIAQLSRQFTFEKFKFGPFRDLMNLNGGVFPLIQQSGVKAVHFLALYLLKIHPFNIVVGVIGLGLMGQPGVLMPLSGSPLGVIQIRSSVHLGATFLFLLLQVGSSALISLIQQLDGKQIFQGHFLDEIVYLRE
jgi:hypothetical protein